MIGKLTGRLDAISTNAVILDVGGVGYEVTVGARTFGALPAIGETVSLAIDTHVREDEIRLYGFVTEHERAWFRALQTVQGIGARIALAVLGTLSTSDLANAVSLGDKGTVSRAPGVGPKVAMRIVAELKDKMPTLAPAIVVGGGYGPVAALPDGLAAQDAVSALTNLGYSRDIAANAVAAAMKAAGEGADSAKLIRLGLKELAW